MYAIEYKDLLWEIMNLRNVDGNGRGVIANRSVIPTFAGKK